MANQEVLFEEKLRETIENMQRPKRELSNPTTSNQNYQTFLRETRDDMVERLQRVSNLLNVFVSLPANVNTQNEVYRKLIFGIKFETKRLLWDHGKELFDEHWKPVLPDSPPLSSND